MEKEQLANILEAAIMAYHLPLTLDKMLELFEENQRPTKNELNAALSYLAEQCEPRGVELQEVASGYRFQSKQEYAPWLIKLWEEKPPKYSRATLETLVLIAYRQPITRAEIEEIRGVSVSSYIVKSLLEREWVRVVGHRDVPGKPGLYGTTKKFLDYFNLSSLNDLPTLEEVQDLDILGQQLNEQLSLDVEGASTGSLAEGDAELRDGSAEAEAMTEAEAALEESPESIAEIHETSVATEQMPTAGADTLIAAVSAETELVEELEQSHDEVAEPTETSLAAQPERTEDELHLPSEHEEKSFMDILNKFGTEPANEAAATPSTNSIDGMKHEEDESTDDTIMQHDDEEQDLSMEHAEEASTGLDDKDNPTQQSAAEPNEYEIV